MKAYDLVLLFLKKKLIFILGVAHGNPSFAKVRPKNCNFFRFKQFFFRTTGFQLKLLKFIESPNIFHWKPAKKIKVGVVLEQTLGQIMSNVVKKLKKRALSIGFFIFYMENTFHSIKAVVVQTPEWKFKVNIARNVTFEGN